MPMCVAVHPCQSVLTLATLRLLQRCLSVGAPLSIRSWAEETISSTPKEQQEFMGWEGLEDLKRICDQSPEYLEYESYFKHCYYIRRLNLFC